MGPNHENLIFDELIADKKHQFVCSFTPGRHGKQRSDRDCLSRARRRTRFSRCAQEDRPVAVQAVTGLCFENWLFLKERTSG